jgi:anti-sigma B factor antagonist
MSDAAIMAAKPLVAGAVLRFSCRRFDTVGAVRTAVAGEPGIAAVPELDLMLRRAQADARVVVLDLCELEFIDWSGAHVLLEAECRARGAGGRLLVGRDTAQIDRLFVLSGVDRRLALVEQPAAVAAPAAMEHAR